MIYNIKFSKQAEKFMHKQDRIQQIRLNKAIMNIPNNGDIKKLQSYSNIYRLRVGDYRIIYHFEKNDIIIEVLVIDNRGDVYKYI